MALIFIEVVNLHYFFGLPVDQVVTGLIPVTCNEKVRMVLSYLINHMAFKEAFVFNTGQLPVLIYLCKVDAFGAAKCEIVPRGL